ncbi:hypothetical protein C8Q76DRAFT_689185 [Earliella scabrosa]|nr:hypothetical protein C8Q76DRAFT_689185 [Earliella scabrosa]
MDARHLIDEDADEREDDNTDAVARDAPAADENAEEHDPEDLAYERPDEDADEDDAGGEDGDERGGPWDSGEDGGSGEEDGDEDQDGDSGGEGKHTIDDMTLTTITTPVFGEQAPAFGFPLTPLSDNALTWQACCYIPS